MDKSLIILLFMVLVAIIIVTVFGRFYIIFFKRRVNKLGKYADEFEVKLKNEGVDSYYRSLETYDLLEEYGRLMEYCHSNINELVYVAEAGCRIKFIEDILAERNINISE